LGREPGAVLLCGRYEGIDQRFIDTHVTHQISLGDFVLSGGELAAMVLLDSIGASAARRAQRRRQLSAGQLQSGAGRLLDCPHYTRPEQWHGQEVPAALLSGHHAQIERWRRDQRLRITAAHRPELIEQARSRGCSTPKMRGFGKNASKL
jgi:tRNA (guanine37-N1)-methyltransferase